MTSYLKPTDLEQVYQLLLAAGPDGLTDRQIAGALGGTGRQQVQRFAKRRIDLVHAGRVAKAKTKRTDPVTEREHQVWVVV